MGREPADDRGRVVRHHRDVNLGREEPLDRTLHARDERCGGDRSQLSRRQAPIDLREQALARRVVRDPRDDPPRDLEEVREIGQGSESDAGEERPELRSGRAEVEAVEHVADGPVEVEQHSLRERRQRSDPSTSAIVETASASSAAVGRASFPTLVVPSPEAQAACSIAVTRSMPLASAHA